MANIKSDRFSSRLQIASPVFLGVPFVGFAAEVLGSVQFKTFLADVMVNLVELVGTTLVDAAIKALFYGRIG